MASSLICLSTGARTTSLPLAIACFKPRCSYILLHLRRSVIWDSTQAIGHLGMPKLLRRGKRTLPMSAPGRRLPVEAGCKLTSSFTTGARHENAHPVSRASAALEERPARRSKVPLRLRDIWAIRVRLQLSHAARDLALFDLAIDSKLLACDLVKLRVPDVAHGDRVAQRATVLQQKTQRPVQFEITEQTRAAISAWMAQASLQQDAFLFSSRLHGSLHPSTRQYARIVDQWIADIGLDVAAYGTHTMGRAKATLIYRRTKNLRAVQLLLGHSKLESAVLSRH